MTAGTIMHRSHLPLKTWLMAVHIVTSHSNGISALQLQASSGSAVTRVPGSCCTSCAAPWSIRTAACLRTWSRSMRPPYRSAP